MSSKTFNARKAIIAPTGEDTELLRTIDALRANGEIVICNLLDGDLAQEDLDDLNCDRQLLLRDGEWIVEKLT